MHNPTGVMGNPAPLDGNSEVLTKLHIPSFYLNALAVKDIGAPGEFSIMVRTLMGPRDGEKEKIHAMITIIAGTVAELLNKPHLCCIESIKIRVLLETIIADALEAYENGDCKLAIKLLRMFVQKAKLLECDLTDEEIKCLQKAVHALVDAAFMIVRENDCPEAAAAIKEAAFFRRAGLYEAALLALGKGCCPEWKLTCDNWDETCPPWMPVPLCFAEPCSLVKCAAGYVCRNNYCGGCNHICCPEPLCPEDVKMCPDGTTVSRDPANDCKFPPCPVSELDDLSGVP